MLVAARCRPGWRRCVRSPQYVIKTRYEGELDVDARERVQQVIARCCATHTRVKTNAHVSRVPNKFRESMEGDDDCAFRSAGTSLPLESLTVI